MRNGHERLNVRDALDGVDDIANSVAISPDDAPRKDSPG